MDPTARWSGFEGKGKLIRHNLKEESGKHISGREKVTKREFRPENLTFTTKPVICLIFSWNFLHPLLHGPVIRIIIRCACIWEYERIHWRVVLDTLDAPNQILFPRLLALILLFPPWFIQKETFLSSLWKEVIESEVISCRWVRIFLRFWLIARPVAVE